MKILILSKDPSLFKKSTNFIGDSRIRHIGYLKALRKQYPDGEIKIITYTSIFDKLNYEKVVPGLMLYGTQSAHRVFFVFDLILCIMKAFRNGWRPSLITSQTPWEEGMIGLVLSKVLNIPFLPQLHFNLFSDEWLAESFINPWRKLVAKIVFKYANRIRVVSSQLAYKVSLNFKIPISKISIAPVGVNFIPKNGSKNLYKQKLSVNLKDKKVVLFVGRLCAAKNLKLFISTARKIINVLPKTMFVIVGEGEERDNIIRWIHEFKVERNFLIIGAQLHTDLPQIYAASDVFLLTSHYEGFGRVILEAQLSGIPVVSTNCIGPNDLIDDGLNGYIIDNPTATKLSEKTIALLNDNLLARKFGNNSKAKAMKKFSIKSLSSNLINIWSITAQTGQR